MERKVYCCGVSINQESGIRTDGCADYVSSVLVGDPVGGLLVLLSMILMRILSDDLGDSDTLLANWSEVDTVWWHFFLSRIMIRVGEAMGLRGFLELGDILLKQRFVPRPAASVLETESDTFPVVDSLTAPCNC